MASRIFGPSGADLSRRGFLVTMAATGAAFGFPLRGLAAMDPASPTGQPVAAVGQTFDPTIWYWIDTTGQVNVNIIKAEMGQHIGTAIARILADELEAPWADVHITYVDADPKWGMMITGGSTSVWQSWPIYRQAGAAGRQALIEAAAQRWGVSSESCTARDGQVTANGQSVSYGDLVAAGLSRRFTKDELKQMPLKPHDQLHLVGQSVTALDIANKTNGKAIYGIDAKADGMVYAVPLLPPTRLGSKVDTIDDSAAKSVRGYQQTIALDDPTGIVPGMVVVVGDTLMAAKWASEKVKVDWTPGQTATVSDKDLIDRGRELIADDSVGAVLDTGNTDTAPVFQQAADTLGAEYLCQSVLHFQLEPVNALAFRNPDGKWEVHTGNQWQSLMLPSLVKAVGGQEGDVIMRTYLIGGGFGRRLNGDYAVPALLASKALDGKPVKLVFFREDDALFDSLRSPSVQKLRMAFDKDKNVIAMEHDAAAGWAMEVLGAGSAMPKGKNGVPYDPNSIDGADHWYTVGAQKVRAISHDLANQTLRPGFLRSVGPGWTNFALESFMDEAAEKLGKDPVAFRLDLLKAEGRNAGKPPSSTGGAARQAHVLQRVAELSGYGKADLPPDSAIGIATSFGQKREMPTWVAGAVRLSVARDSGEVSVQKIWLVVDCGTVIDPDNAHAQTVGAALWGLSMALYEGTEIVNGQTSARNLDRYTPVRMIDTPPIEVEFVDSSEMPVGLGEPGVTVIAPAIANAIRQAVGVRLRQIPMTPDAIRTALGQQQ